MHTIFAQEQLCPDKKREEIFLSASLLLHS